ncbi:MAG: FGGY-family carbohydrate kinase, partial [Pseudomonadota bacterium]
ATGTQFDQLTVIGGGAASRYWVKLIATVLDVPLARPEAGEFGAALGAARLAIVAKTGADPESIMTPPPIREVIEPDADLRAAFDAAYGQFRASYPAIKSLG